MSENEVRNPVQKRSIEKKNKIIEAGFNLICEKGYYNTNTAEIAKAAGVSTGIVYNYFNDKHDILIEGIKQLGASIFYPMLNMSQKELAKKDLKLILNKMIKHFIEDHKLSETAHEEIMAMTHSDPEIAYFFHEREFEMTQSITNLLIENGFNDENLKEKVHISIGLMDNLCHEIVYHKHKKMNYKIMKDLVIDTIYNLLT